MAGEGVKEVFAIGAHGHGREGAVEEGSDGFVAADGRQGFGGRSLTVHGDGGQVRCFAHVDDVAADLVRLVAMDDAPAGALNLGGVARATVAELAATVAAAVGSDPGRVRSTDPLQSVSTRFEEVLQREPDLGRARSLGLGQARRDLTSIVADTVRRHPALA